MSVFRTLRAVDRAQKRFVFLALGLALLLHVMLAGAFGFYHLHGMQIPADNTINPAGPFTVKRIEINPDDLKSDQSDPIARLPVAEPPKNPAQFNLDPHLVENALQAPLPKLSAPAIPDATRVIAATDLDRNLPYVESDTAKVSAEISTIQPTTSNGPLVSSKLAQDILSTSSGLPQPGAPGVQASGPISPGGLPGFSDLAGGFHTGGATVSNLPDPVLLRLPSDVLFDFNSAVLRPQAGPLLDQAVTLITKYPSAEVQIDGYSDSFGKPDYNLTLSQQRAQAVQAGLQERIAAATYKFRSQGHGSSNYIVAQGSIDEQQPNRRVEILIQALKP